jgi:hypothetical protein
VVDRFINACFAAGVNGLGTSSPAFRSCFVLFSPYSAVMPTSPPDQTRGAAPVKGRGAVSNASGRYEAQAREAFDDGWDAYIRGAGWAEGKFSIRTGKLPMPGKGPIDLSSFEEFMAP